MFFSFTKKDKEETTRATKEVKTFEPQGLEELISFIKKSCGIDLEPKKDVLYKRFSTYCKNREFTSFYELMQRMKKDEELMQEIIDFITVNETYFYRELPQLKESISYINRLNYRVNILCAPCSTGEEVYSLAFLAKEAGIANERINILGIDINSQAIDSAKKASYNERSLHRLDDSIKSRYFTCKEGRYHVIKDNLPSIDFQIANIFDEKFKRIGQFDIIYSRNMMIYFNDEYKLKAIKSFYDLLSYGGRLYTGHADLVPATSYFEKVVKDRLYFYQKGKTCTQP